MRTVGTPNWTTSLNSPAPRTSAGSKRRSSHISGEYSVVEDSRDTSQVNSTGEPPPRREFWRISWPCVSTFQINTNMSATAGAAGLENRIFALNPLHNVLDATLGARIGLV